MSEPMDEDMGDAVFLDFMGPSDAETHMPPPMYAVPAAALGILPRGTRVTVGVPGSHWLIEENIIIDGPQPGPDGEVYNLICLAEWGAVTLRPHEQHNLPEGQSRLLPWQAPVSRLWVYRFAKGVLEVSDLPAWHPHLWFDNVRTDLDTPPSPRRPRRLPRQQPALAFGQVVLLVRAQGHRAAFGQADQVVHLTVRARLRTVRLGNCPR